MHPVRPLLILLLTLFFVLPAAQAQWKWRDRNGQVTASDLPPPKDIPDKDVLQRPDPAVRKPAAVASAPASAASARSTSDPELEARRRNAEAEAAAKLKAEDARLARDRAENCQRARNQLATLESGQRIARMNDKGEREFLDDKAIADEARRARGVIAGDCR